MLIKSRQDLSDYCLRRLGEGVITINVTDEQIEDRIDDALQLFTQYHFDATETVYWKHELTQEDIDRKDENGQSYLLVNENIIGIVRAFQLTTLTTGSYLFDVKYQLFLNNLFDFSNVTLQYYSTVRQHLRNIEMMFNGETPIRYNRHKNRLYLDTNWETAFFAPGNFIIIEAYSTINPEEFTDVFNDMWLKAYATALIKKQWGVNLMKYQSSSVLPSGISVNGMAIYQAAENDIQKLEMELQDKYTLPPNFFIG